MSVSELNLPACSVPQALACVLADENGGELVRYGGRYWAGRTAAIDKRGKPVGGHAQNNTVMSLIKNGHFRIKAWHPFAEDTPVQIETVYSQNRD
ncbi:MAG: hypothetical protein AAF571_03410 [Verrucomicrobiota bacterium]